MAYVRRENDGVWSVRVYLGTDAIGGRIRRYKRLDGARDESEARRMADEFERKLRDGLLASGPLLADVLDEYVDMRELTGWAPASARQGRCWCRKVRRMMPRASVASVTTRDLQDFELTLSKPKSDGGEGLSRSSVLSAHDFLNGAFKRIVAEGVRKDDPMVAVAKPRPDRVEVRPFGDEDIPNLVGMISSAIADGDPRTKDYATAVAAMLALVTGERVGEVCAIRRRDVSPRDDSIHVCGNVTEAGGLRRRDVTKGRRSRTVSVTERDMGKIAEVFAAQDAAMPWLGPDSPLVTTDGSIMRPSVVSARFRRMAVNAGLPRDSHFHMLRHTHATLCLRDVDLKTVSLRLGHAKETTTLAYYAHVLPGYDSAAAEAFSREVDYSLAGCATSVPAAGEGTRAVGATKPQDAAGVATELPRPPLV